MPLTILMVDDDLGTRLSISDYLGLSGYNIITADDGEEGLTMFEEHCPDLVITDIIMPRMNGYELVRRVRQQFAFRLLPIILLTARNKIQERILGYQSGCDLYLPKPFQLEELSAAISNLLERAQIIQSECSFPRPTSLSVIQGETSLEMNNSVSIHLPNTQMLTSLTSREQEALELLTHGLSNAEIGLKLHLSPRTVEKYVSNLFRKTSTSNRAELVRFAIKHSLVD
jgi:DNA-binding NarL/FixJ family response regulator